MKNGEIYELRRGNAGAKVYMYKLAFGEFRSMGSSGSRIGKGTDPLLWGGSRVTGERASMYF
jgi:hypothetical protein